MLKNVLLLLLLLSLFSCESNLRRRSLLALLLSTA